MRHLYRNDTKLCRAPLLGNGDLVFPMDAEGGITEALPVPAGLPSSALYRLARPLEDGKPYAYGYLYPELSYMSIPLGKPYQVQTEFSTDEAVFSSVCKYDHGVTVETRACAFYGRPLLIVQKRITAPGPFTVGYRFAAKNSLCFTAEGGMLLAERPLDGEREKLAFFSTHPLTAMATPDGGRLFGKFHKNANVTFFLAFAETDRGESDGVFSPLSDLQGYVYKVGENRLFNEHIASWRRYREENEFVPDHPLLSRVADGSQYLLRVFASRLGAPLSGLHPYAPFGHSPSVDLRVLSALLHGGHTEEARKILSELRRMLRTAESRFGGAGKPGARYPYYADRTGHECLPDDYRRDMVVQTADVAVAFHKYYRFTEDRKFLAEEAYPVMKSAAVYLFERAFEKTATGIQLRVPDPLTSGTSATRPLLTGVAVAAALSAFAEVAGLLSADADLAARARRTSEELVRTLPLVRGVYTAAEGEDMPGRTPLFLYPYRVSLREEPFRKATVYAGLTASRVSPPLYDLALLSSAYANQHVSAMSPLMKVAEAADEFGFLPMGGAEGLSEMPALFLDALYRSSVAYADGVLYLGFGLDADCATDGEFFLPLPIGASVEGRIRGGRFVSLRVHKKNSLSARTVDLVIPKWLYADGAAVAVRKTERGGVMYIHTVTH